MLNQNFCHLHLHSEYSLLDGFGSCENYAKYASQLGFKYLAITDHGSIDGLIKFQKACNKYSIKPIFGCEPYIVEYPGEKQKGEKRGHVTLFVKNETGFKNLCKLLNLANSDGYYRRPRIGYDNLIDHCEGLVVMTACVSSFLTQSYGEDLFWELDSKIGNDLYLEIMPHDHELQLNINELCLNIHAEYPDIKLVATNDTHYIKKNDVIAQEVLLAVQRKAKWNDPKRFKFSAGFDELYLKTANEMLISFEKLGYITKIEYLSALNNSLEVAKKCCDFELKKREIKLPKIKRDVTDEEYLKQLCYEGLESLSLSSVDSKKYIDRFEFEFNLLEKKKFISYFLMVHEIIEWCCEKQIMVGPGRGSSAGSLIAYLLGITTIDPIKHNLLFERFISLERDGLPDFDVDFEDLRRDEIRLHMIDLYGENNIANVSTFMEMKSRSCIRDVSRVFDVPLEDVNNFCKLVEDDVEIEETFEKEPFFRNKYPEVTELILSMKGTIRTAGINAAALIVAPEDISKSTYGVLVKRKGSLIINWDKEDVEYMGLLKFDYLGLNTLTILNETANLIYENHKEDIVFEDINIEDKDVLTSINGVDTAGLFQLSGHLAKQVTKDLKVDSFEDIVSIMALGRPGPFRSLMTQDFIDRKHGKKWEEKGKLYEEVLKDTYGLLIFQENVMFVANKVAGMTFSEADKMRKIIGKKRDKTEFEQFKRRFIGGCLKNKTLSKQEAEKVWEAILEHAGYSFGRAHSVSYATIAYYCAYLKYYYPTEFFCANLTYGKKEKKVKVIEEVFKHNLKIVLPKIGLSSINKWVAKGNKLFCPFTEIKTIGEKKAFKILALKKPNKLKYNNSFFGKPKNKSKVIEEEKASSLEKIINDIDAWEADAPITPKAQEHFEFNISNSPNVLYPNLCDIINDMFPIDMKDILNGKIGYPDLIKKTKFVNRDLLECSDCELRNECKSPVLPDPGFYNISIVGTNPGNQEDVESKGLNYKFYNDLLKKIKKAGYDRNIFHVTNICKCHPGVTKTPNSKHTDSCKKWIKEEFEKIDCKIILAFGSLSVNFFLNDDTKKITQLNATTTWNDKYKCWICWCIHPSFATTDKENKKKFKYGIKNFIDTLKLFGLKKNGL